MLKLNRTTEYALIALRYLSQKPNRAAASAREMADAHGLPFDILAKTLQRLKDSGLLVSAQGARGGYRLHRPLSQVHLGEFLELMEGPGGVVACADQSESPNSCEFRHSCQIQGMMKNLNSRLQEFLAGIPLSELTVSASAQSAPQSYQLETFLPPQVRP